MSALSFHWPLILTTLLLLLIANGAPIIVRNLLGELADWPLDFNKQLKDGFRLFGSSKTWRGVISSIFFTAIIAPVFSVTTVQGGLIALFSMVGDSFGSFIKRRLGYQQSSRFRLLDALPESLLPIVLMQQSLGLSAIDIIVTAALFFLSSVVLSSLLYRLHIRQRPY